MFTPASITHVIGASTGAHAIDARLMSRALAEHDEKTDWIGRGSRRAHVCLPVTRSVCAFRAFIHNAWPAWFGRRR